MKYLEVIIHIKPNAMKKAYLFITLIAFAGIGYGQTIENKGTNEITYGSQVSFDSGDIEELNVKSLNETTFVVCYQDNSNYNHGTSKIGIVTSENVITYGAPNIFNPGSTYWISVDTLDETHFVICYQDSTNSKYGTAIIGTVSGNTISYGAEYTFNITERTENISVSTLDGTHFVVAFTDQFQNFWGKTLIGTVSGSSISYGDAYDFKYVPTKVHICALDASHFIVAYKENATYDGYARLGTISDGVISFGSESLFEGVTMNNYITISPLSTTQFVITWLYSYYFNHSCRSKIGTISGSSISFGESYKFNGTSVWNIVTSTMDPTHYVISYRDKTLSGKTLIGSIYGSTINFSSKYDFTDTTNANVSVSSLDATHFVVGYGGVNNLSESGSAKVGHGYFPLTLTWDGSLNSTWSVTDNWDFEIAPTESYDVIIPNGVTYNPVVFNDPSSPAICKDLNINSDAELTIASGKALTVAGSITNNSGNSGLIIESSGNNCGSLIGGGTPSTTVKRYITGYTNAENGWHLLSSPVGAFSINGSSFDPGVNDDLFRWEETTALWMNHKVGDPALIMPGTGYLAAYQITTTKSYVGSLNYSDIPLTNLSFTTETNATGWHLLGNPYPCALNWNPSSGSGWNLNNVNGAAKIWHAENASYSDIPADGIIPATQGFMIYVSSSTNSITLPLTNRVHSTTDWYKDNEMNKIKLTVYDIEGSTAQESIISFNENATVGFDNKFDSYFLAGYAPQFYSTINEGALSTNTIPEITSSTTIPLLFIKNTSTDYYIEVEGVNNLEPQETVYLTDLKINHTQSLNENSIYNFTSQEGDIAERFLLHFSPLIINEQDLSQQINIFSCGANVEIRSKSPINAKVNIYNLSGQLLTQKYMNNESNASISITNHKGITIISIITEQQSTTQKVTIW